MSDLTRATAESIVAAMAEMTPEERQSYLKDLEAVHRHFEGIYEIVAKFEGLAVRVLGIPKKPTIKVTAAPLVPPAPKSLCASCANPCARYDEKLQMCQDHHERVPQCQTCSYFDRDIEGENGACVAGHSCTGGRGYVPEGEGLEPSEV